MRFAGGSHPKAPDTAPAMPAGMALLPQSVVAFGGPQQSVERLIGLQSAFARGVHLLASIGQLWPSRLNRPIRPRQPGNRLAALGPTH